MFHPDGSPVPRIGGTGYAAPSGAIDGDENSMAINITSLTGFFKQNH